MTQQTSVGTAVSRGGSVPALRRNPYFVALIAVGGFALVVAFMLWIVVGQMTDWATYEIEPVAEVIGWMALWVILGVVSIVGAVVLAGVSWTIARTRSVS